MTKKNSGLGSGMSALFEDNSTDVQVKQILRLSEIEPNKLQPRKDFDETAIADLAESIKIHGILQPLIVRPLFNGTYQIIAGERRWRAARMLGMDEIPVIIKDIDDSTAMQIALIENLQRENLNPMEEACGYKELADKFNMKQDDIAKTVGKSRSTISHAMRLFSLPDEVQELLRDGKLTMGHAKALAGIDDEELQIELAQRAAADKLTVRGIEKACAKLQKDEQDSEKTPDSYYKEMELSLNSTLGRKVRVSYSNNKGALYLEFYDKDDLAALADILCKNQ